jgi:penicillin-binding protein-related factor A (putative recombinase)
MTEADFQSIFTKWAKKHAQRSAAYELKICKAKSMPFNRVEEHQIASLYRAKHGGMFYKISDMSLGYKPFDAFSLCGADAFVVVMFYVPGSRRYCYAIDIDTFIEESVESKRKSLTEARAKEIGTIIDLKGGE